MSLIIDHKNGNHYDWRLVNLRILCPNCNATLETHCKGHKYIEEKKKREIIKKNNIEEKHIKNRIIKIRPSYKQLKKDIKKLGFVQTGKKYGVSDNGIRKWIKFYER